MSTGYQIFVSNFASATLGSAAGRTVQLNNFAAALVSAIVTKYTATATAGNRAVTILLKDPGGNVISASQAGAAIAANGSPTITWGSGGGSFATGFANSHWTAPLNGQILPPGTQLTVLDATNVDVNDTVIIAVTLAM